jgi:hypothetical protein
VTRAFEIPGGRLVRHEGRVWLKAERPSRDYINHYLVATQAGPRLTLVYIDPETDLQIVAQATIAANLSPKPPGEEAHPGDLLVTEAGRGFVKAYDVKKDGQHHLAYVDIQSGAVRPRQERGQLAIYAAWELIAS